MKTKNKKALEGGTWWIIVGAIVAIALGAIILFISKEGLSSGWKNIDLLSSCQNQGGECKQSCSQDESGFYKLGGCNKDTNDDGEVDESDKIYCCVPKEKK